MAAGIALFFGLCALAIDAGIAYVARARINKAADAAALAAVKYASQGRATMRNVAAAVGQANFPNTTFRTTIRTNADDSVTVRVVGRRRIQTLFSNVARVRRMNVASAAEATRQPIDLSLLLDVGQATAAPALFTAMTDGAERLLNQMDDATDRVGVVQLATAAAQVTPLRRNFRSAAVTAIRGLQAQRDTNLVHGLQLSSGQLTGVTPRGTSPRRMLLVVTDGPPNAFTATLTGMTNLDTCPGSPPATYLGALAAYPAGGVRGLFEPTTRAFSRRIRCLRSPGANQFTAVLDPLPLSPVPSQLPDGATVTGDHIRTYAAAASLAAARATRAAGITINVIAVSNAAAPAPEQPDPVLLAQIANQAGADDPAQPRGKVYAATDASSIATAIDDLIAAVIDLRVSL